MSKYKYICLEAPASIFQPIQGVFKTLEEAMLFSKKTKTVIFEAIKPVDYSRWEFMFDDESEINEEWYSKNGYSKEEIEEEKADYVPRFYIQNRNKLSDDRGCELPDWANAMEYCYEVPTGWSKERAREYLLALGMKERDFTCGY